MKKIFFNLVLAIAVIVFLLNILWRTVYSSTSLDNDQKWSYLTKNAPILEMLQAIASSSLINGISKTFESRWLTKAETCQGLPEDTMDSIFHLKNIQCSKLFSADKAFMNHTLNQIKQTSWTMLSNEYYINLTTDCPRFKQSRGYVTCKLTQEEEDFPIAYSLIIYKDIEMVERLLRAIYRPQNYYCIHVDKKSDQNFFIAVSAIAKCFENVFIAPERLAVHWGTYTVLEPELVCMQQLWRFRKWKYFINLTGQEFPLRTNWELVQILKSYRGANDLEGTIKRLIRSRLPTDPPHNITAIKGSVHIAVNRDFVDYILHHRTAKDLLDWVKNTSIPDETFFTTLNHNPQLGIRGTYKGVPETDNDDSMIKPFLTRFKNWGEKLCAGHWVRGICILSTGDLPLLGRAKHMFANKFFLWEDPIAIGCLEEMIYNNTRDELSGVKVFNSTFYSQLGFVLNQFLRSKWDGWTEGQKDQAKLIASFPFTGPLKIMNDERRWSNAPPLSGIQPVKGSVHIVVNRHYVDFILHTKAALKLLKWTKRTRVPDETFFPTLNFNPQLSINGSYSGSPNEIQQSINRYKIWYTQDLCAGRLRRGICILSTGDLPRLGQSKHLFANKFLIHEDSVVIGCLEEKLANETRDEYACRKMFDATWYSRLDFVQKQIRTYGENI